jgi:hypothetical protein
MVLGLPESEDNADAFLYQDVARNAGLTEGQMSTAAAAGAESAAFWICFSDQPQ